jgi:PDZ domain
MGSATTAPARIANYKANHMCEHICEPIHSTGRILPGKPGITMCAENTAYNEVGGAGEEGVVVTDVDPNGSAADHGLEVGDVILDVGGKAVSNAGDVRKAVREAQTAGKHDVLMRLKSSDRTKFVALRLGHQSNKADDVTALGPPADRGPPMTSDIARLTSHGANADHPGDHLRYQPSMRKSCGACEPTTTLFFAKPQVHWAPRTPRKARQHHV